MHEINGEVAIKLLCWPNDRNQTDNIMRSVGYLLLVSAVSLLKIEASLTQELSAEDRACIVSAVAKLPNVPALKIERSRALPQSQSQGRRNLSLYNVMIEIDVSIVGENANLDDERGLDLISGLGALDEWKIVFLVISSTTRRNASHV